MSDAHATLGRSSREGSPGSGEDEIVEPEQGNGIVSAPPLDQPVPPRSLLIWKYSALAYHFAAPTGRRLESGRPAHFHPGA